MAKIKGSVTVRKFKRVFPKIEEATPAAAALIHQIPNKELRKNMQNSYNTLVKAIHYCVLDNGIGTAARKTGEEEQNAAMHDMARETAKAISNLTRDKKAVLLFGSNELALSIDENMKIIAIWNGIGGIAERLKLLDNKMPELVHLPNAAIIKINQLGAENAVLRSEVRDIATGYGYSMHPVSNKIEFINTILWTYANTVINKHHEVNIDAFGELQIHDNRRNNILLNMFRKGASKNEIEKALNGIRRDNDNNGD